MNIVKSLSFAKFDLAINIFYTFNLYMTIKNVK